MRIAVALAHSSVWWLSSFEKEFRNEQHAEFIKSS